MAFSLRELLPEIGVVPRLLIIVLVVHVLAVCLTFFWASTSTRSPLATSSCSTPWSFFRTTPLLGPQDRFAERNTTPVLPILVFLEFLVFFPSEDFLVFLSVFPFFPVIFGLGRDEKKSWFWLMVFLAISPKTRKGRTGTFTGVGVREGTHFGRKSIFKTFRRSYRAFPAGPTPLDLIPSEPLPADLFRTRF